MPVQDVGDEALKYFQALRAGAPNMLIIVLGPFTDWNNAEYSSHLTSCRNAIFASAAKVSGTYTVDVSDWVSLANRDQVFLTTKNGPHPIDSGHEIYGKRAADAIRALFP